MKTFPSHRPPKNGHRTTKMTQKVATDFGAHICDN